MVKAVNVTLSKKLQSRLLDEFLPKFVQKYPNNPLSSGAESKVQQIDATACLEIIHSSID